MPCTNCHTTNNNCGCNPQPCTTTPCDCAAGYFSSDCTNNVKSIFSCLDIPSNLTLTETLEQIDAQICIKFNTITNYSALVNIGNGANLYKGVNNLGQKEIRRVNKVGNLIKVTENTNDVSISIDELALNTFIEANNFTTVAMQLDPSIGKNIYKNTTTVGNVSTLNFRSLIHSPQGGVGESIVRDIQENENNLTIRTKKINSTTLTISSNEDNTELSIDTPTSATIPALYVNNLYEPSYDEFLAGNTKGLGTFSKPFTDTIVSWTFGGSPVKTPNTAIQNAFDAYVGDTGTYSRLNPERLGEKIIIQDNQGAHVYPSPSTGLGDFNYTGLDIIIQGNVLSQKTGFLLDLDDSTAFSQTNAYAKVTVEEGAILQIEGEGFNNSGNNVGTISYATGKIINLLGSGIIYSAYNGGNYLNRYIINSGLTIPANNNDGNTTFTVYCTLRADYQGVYKVAGNSRVDFYGKLISGLLTIPILNANIKPFLQIGGQVRMFGADVDFSTSVPTPRRIAAFYFEPDGVYSINYVSQNTRYGGNATSLFKKVGTPSVFLEVTGLSAGYGLDINEVFESPNLWSVRFTNNILATGNIDENKVDLTNGNIFSSLNTVGGNIIETLRTYASKNLAQLTLIPKGGAYLVKRDVNAGDFVVGTEYKIKTSGSPSVGTVGDYFIATDSGVSNVGAVATLITRETMV